MAAVPKLRPSVRSHLLTFNVSECQTMVVVSHWLTLECYSMLVVSHLVKYNAGLMNFHFIERPRCQNCDRPFAHICSHFMKIKLLNVGKMFPDMVLCCVVLWCVVLCCVVLCCGVVWCGMLCCGALWWCGVLCCLVVCCGVVL